jgi:hypothetical protein
MRLLVRILKALTGGCLKSSVGHCRIDIPNNIFLFLNTKQVYFQSNYMTKNRIKMKIIYNLQAVLCIGKNYKCEIIDDTYFLYIHTFLVMQWY